MWCLWYYSGLYRKGRLLSAAQTAAENVGAMLLQHLALSLPFLLIAAAAFLLLQGDFGSAMGLTAGEKRGRIAIDVFGGGYCVMLIAALLVGRTTLIAAAYQWGYYLVFVAFTEEFIFRAVLPLLLERSSLPEWCVWVVPGVLFGMMHTLIPVVKGGVTVEVLLSLLSTVTGYTAGSCAFYGLRRWSGTLWLPVLIHAAMDFSGVLF